MASPHVASGHILRCALDHKRSRERSAVAESENPTLKEVLTDALRYWEPRRIAYNAVLALIVLGSIARAWPSSRSIVSLPGLLFFFVLAVLANICYATVYMVDVPVQLSGFRDSWKKWRWLLWLVGTLFAGVLAFYWMGDEVIGS